MNVLSGNIAEVRVNGELSIVRVKVGDHLLSSIVIDTPETADYLVPGGEVRVIFKETEVIIGTGSTEGISLRNKFRGRVEKIDSDILLSWSKSLPLETDDRKSVMVFLSAATRPERM